MTTGPGWVESAGAWVGLFGGGIGIVATIAGILFAIRMDRRQKESNDIAAKALRLQEQAGEIVLAIRPRLYWRDEADRGDNDKVLLAVRVENNSDVGVTITALEIELETGGEFFPDGHATDGVRRIANPVAFRGELPARAEFDFYFYDAVPGDFTTFDERWAQVKRVHVRAANRDFYSDAEHEGCFATIREHCAYTRILKPIADSLPDEGDAPPR